MDVIRVGDLDAGEVRIECIVCIKLGTHINTCANYEKLKEGCRA
jgi:hypothetical protein